MAWHGMAWHGMALPGTGSAQLPKGKHASCTKTTWYPLGTAWYRTLFTTSVAHIVWHGRMARLDDQLERREALDRHDAGNHRQLQQRYVAHRQQYNRST